MQERIEPPILLSRLMTFVMATSLVVLVVLVITLDKMFPLNRPQVFVLQTQNLDDKELSLTSIPDDLENYKKEFIKDYVRERNEIVPDLAIMRARWANNNRGVIKTRSTDAVFGDFVTTDMVQIIYQNLGEAFDIECNVEFPASHSVVLEANRKDTYAVQFKYVCRYGDLYNQQYTQYFTVHVTLQSTEGNSIKWAERMENPLGLRVSGYVVGDGKNDPLNWIQKK